MASHTMLQPALINAYSQTHYRVLAAQPFTLHIGRHSSALQTLHALHGVDCSAFVTAFNPFSRSLSAACNGGRHQRLLGRLKRQGWGFVQGYGRHPSGNWPAERSVLILGMTSAQAQALGVALQQNAIVCSGADAVPELVLLQSMS